MNKANNVHVGSDSPFFYQPDIVGEHCSLPPDESRHIARVLRLKTGDNIRVTDGKGKVYRGALTAVSPQQCGVEVLDTVVLPKKEYSIHIAIAPTKNMSRIEWFIEKSVEIGIEQFSFILCKNAERRFINLERLTKKAISALKQSKQAWLPVLNPMVPFADVLKVQSDQFIAHIGNPASPSLQSVVQPGRDYFILIGPEGGFTANELVMAQKAGFKSVRLGNNRLRTETAGVVACYAFNFINQQDR